MRRKRRRIPALQIGERRQYQPGELAQSLDPALCERLEELALAGYAEQGRGLLIVTLNVTTETRIVSAEYIPLHELAETSRAVPFAETRPAMLAVHQYDPENEFMALVLDLTPSLPAPQIWYDLFPRMGQTSVNEAAPAQQQESSADRREETINAYITIEALAREGYATQGRGFVFYGAYADGETEPYVAYLTLDGPPGDGCAASAPDLVAYVRTYDPRTSFVIFDAVVNLDGEQLEQVKIDVWTFMTGIVTPSA